MGSLSSKHREQGTKNVCERYPLFLYTGGGGHKCPISNRGSNGGQGGVHMYHIHTWKSSDGEVAIANRLDLEHTPSLGNEVKCPVCSLEQNEYL